MSERNPDGSNSSSDVKEENEALMHRDIEKSSPRPHHYNKELTTHGMRDDIDEKTPLRDVVFERANEDIEAPHVQTIHHKKESQTNGTSLAAESKLDSLSDVKAPNIFERVLVHTEKSPHHHKETHGMRDDIDENTPLNDVKAPNMFERAKEEIEAFVQTIHPKKESQTKGTRGEAIMAESKTYLPSENDVKTPNSIERAKEGSEATMHAEKSPVHHRHHKETHGMSDDIDEKTPIDEVKGPNVFERAKEELEALVQTIHPKKDSDIHVSSSNMDGGFRFFIGRGLEKVCRPWGTKEN